MEKWVHRVAGLIWGWYPGQTGNISIAKIIFGQINPGGHLPDTFSRHWRDDAAYHHFPGYPGVFNHRWHSEPAYAGFPSGKGARCKFVEGIFIGYRWFNYKHIRPLFPFGFGLSYTHFAFRNLHVTSSGQGNSRVITVTAQVENIGHQRGAEVAQLYVHPPGGGRIARVVQKLEGFARVVLNPGQIQSVQFTLRPHAFATYDSATHQWLVPSGRYMVEVGGSSADEPLKAVVNWKSTHVIGASH